MQFVIKLSQKQHETLRKWLSKCKIIKPYSIYIYMYIDTYPDFMKNRRTCNPSRLKSWSEN